MPWYFPWPEYIKKRACRYLLQHYLGNFLQEKLTLDQLSVDLYNGKGTIKNVALDIWSLNELAETFDSPVEVIEGVIGSISISVPWSALLRDSCEIEIHNLDLTLQPRYRSEECDVQAMAESMWSSMSMTTSMQLAQECFKQEPSESEQQADNAQRYEGLELFAQTIESVLSRVKMTFIDTVIRIEHVPKDSRLGVALEIHVKRIEFFDENASDQGSSVDQDVPNKHEPAAIAHKKFHLMGVSLYCDEFPDICRTLSRESSLDSESSYKGQSSQSPPLSPPMPPNHAEMNTRLPGILSPPKVVEHSEPIKIAGFAGRQEIQLKIKQNDGIPGPKVEIESYLGSINFFLSPNQVNLLQELVHGILSPASSDVAPVPGRVKNKVMQPEDFRRIEATLQEQLQRQRFLKQEGKAMNRYHLNYQEAEEGLYSQCLIDDDEHEDLYFSMTTSGTSLQFMNTGDSDMESSFNSNYSTSTVDTNRTGMSSLPRFGYGNSYTTGGSSLSSSPFTSSIPKGARKGPRLKKSLPELVEDPAAEVTRYKLKCSSVTLVILHENPLSTPDHDPSTAMKTLSTSYFQGVGNAGGKNFVDLREKIAKSCPYDHLQLLFAPITFESDRKTTSAMTSTSVDLSVGLLEVVEALYERSLSSSVCGVTSRTPETVPPTYAEILTFTEDHHGAKSLYASQIAGSPCLKLKVKNLVKNPSQGHQSSRSSYKPRTDILLEIGNARIELDMTLVDRLTSLLNPQPLQDSDKYSMYKSLHHANIPMTRQAFFSQAIDETPTYRDQRIDIHVTCPSSVIALKFPIPDLRPQNDIDRRPWWKRALRKETLFVEVTEAAFYTKLGGYDQVGKYELTFKEMHGLFQEDQDEAPVSFIRISHDQHDETSTPGVNNGFNWPRIVVKVSPTETGPVLEEEAESSDSNQFSSMEDAMQFGKQEPSPFSSKKVLYDGEEMVMPGDQAEMAEFAEKANSNTRIQLELNFPNISGCLRSKKFFECIYNRLLNDMLLWEPAAPTPVYASDSTSIFMSTTAGLDLATQMRQNPTFAMCRSIHGEFDSDSDDNDESGQFSSYFDPKMKRKRKSEQLGHLQSYMTVTLNIGHGRVDLCLPVKDENGDVCTDKHGEALLDVEDGSLFLVAKYLGDPDLTYMSIQSNRVTLYHNSDVKSMVTRDTVEVASKSLPDQLHPCVYKSEAGLSTKLSAGSDNANMLAVASKIHLDTKRDVKHMTVAVGVKGGTLQHRVTASGQSWLTQIMDFFDVWDESILGYEPPAILTELHTHFWNCAIDYRPLYLPIRSILTAETFTLSSNIVYDAPISLLRFLIEDAALYLSDKTEASKVDLKKNYVCVMDMGFFELSLKTSDGKISKYPKVDLQASNNVLNIRTCADSCDALRKLIVYFANDGDLNPPIPRSSQPSQDMSTAKSMPSQPPPASAVSTSPIAQGHLEQMQNLMEEAMKDYSPTNSQKSDEGSDLSSPSNLRETSSGEASIFLFPDEQSRNERSMKNSTRTTQRKTSPVDDDSFDDDDEFCILDVPGMGISPRDGEPKVTVLEPGPTKIVNNHFKIPATKKDILKAPDHFPDALYRYTVKEIALVWYLYGGKDFESTADEKVPQGSRCSSPSSSGSRSSTPEKTRSRGRMGSPSFAERRNSGSKLRWQSKGGAGRKQDVLMELQMNKVRMQYEIYPEDTEQASRQILLINDIEIRDRLIQSQINKFLYQYASEDRPRQAHANMLMIKALHIRPDPALPREECCLRVAIQPLRLNIDQDALFFLREFFAALSEGVIPEYNPVKLNTASKAGGDITAYSQPKSLTSIPNTLVSEDAPSSLSSNASNDMIDLDISDVSDTSTLIHETVVKQERPSTPAATPVFYRSFTFAPEVPIRLDYQGKHMAFEEGTFAGILIGLGQLNCSELKLRRLQFRQGLLGIDKVVNYTMNEWMSDIKRNQLPSILGGVGPMHSLVQLVQGMVDLVRLPIEQYQKDGRIVRGLQRGAHSFTTSTAMSALELTNRLVQCVQAVAETTYDMVSPGPSVSRYSQGSGVQFVQHRLAQQPADLREGMATAYKVVTEGLGDTAGTIMRVAREEHEHKGMSGAVGGVLRQIPPTVVKPLIIATEATSSVLGGVRNQLKPDARKEATEKWRCLED
ncbi:autophagy-related protein 2 homolog A-like [Glandiceps talaboti]